MTLYDGQIGSTYRIIGFDTTDSTLKDRFISFGIAKNKVCEVVSHSISRLAVAIMIGGVQVALRDSEARAILVEQE